MNAALIGSVSSSAAVLRGMLRGGLEVGGVCGLHRRHAANVSDYVDLEPLAGEAGIPFLAFDRVTEPAVSAFLLQHRPDWLFVVGLSQLVPADLCPIAPAGAIGFHPTPLPEGRGRAPVAWTILRGRPAAANLFFLTDEPDAGDIIAQRPVPVLPDDYAADLIARTNVVLEELVAELSPAFAAGTVPRTPQDHSWATWYPRRRPEDGLIDWNRSAQTIYRLIRAISHPYPGAFTFCQGHKMVVWRASPVAGTGGRPVPGIDAPPGTVVDRRDSHPLVQTASGLLALTDIHFTDAAAADLKVGAVLGV